MLSGASAFSVCSAVKFKDLAISLENSIVPCERFIYVVSRGFNRLSKVMLTIMHIANVEMNTSIPPTA